MDQAEAEQQLAVAKLAAAKAKVVQIIPAERGWHVGAAGDPLDEVACWALLGDGTVVAMIRDGDASRLVPAEKGDTIYSPVASFEYRAVGNYSAPDKSDWELVSATDAGSIWRRPHGK